jgi:DNA-binding GntR family transcriptional regulator
MTSSKGTANTAARRNSRAPALVPTRVAPYDLLKKAILSGQLRPGEPLVENTLAAWCQTSRTPIREALRRLDQDGLIQRTDRGMEVRKRSPEEILDIYETRIVLEATAGRVAAERRTEHDLLLMRRLNERCAEAAESDPDGMSEANQEFHRAVWRASHNESLLDVLGRLNLHLARYPGTTLAAPGRWTAAQEQHDHLVDAIEARDGDRACAVALEHFTIARNIRLELFADEFSER